MTNHERPSDNNRIMDEFTYTFPETPDIFKQAVKETVDNNLHTEHTKKICNLRQNKQNNYKVWKFPKAAFAAICILLIGGTVSAIGISKINKHLGTYGYQVPEKMINTETSTTSKDYLIIDEVYFDGTYLTFTAHLPEGATDIPFDASDGVTVNGQSCLLDQFEKGSEEPGSYFIMVNTSYNSPTSSFDEILSGDKITVDMGLCINDSWEKIPFTFEATVDKSSGNTVSIPEQTIEIDDGITAQVSDSTISPTAILLNIHFSASGDNADTRLEKYTSWHYYTEDSNGNRFLLEDISRSAQCGEDWFAEITDFDRNSDYIKLIPYTLDYDPVMDKEIYGTEKADEEHAFVIHLK